jgi:DNA sulfur modification protein DndB
MIETASLDLSAGKYVKGIPLAEDGYGARNFLAVTNFAQLKTITRDPFQLQTNAKRGTVSEDLEEEVAIHELVQRALKDAKKSNVPKYATYIEELVAVRREGVLPPIHLWAEEALEVVSLGGVTYLLVPNDAYLISIDGETQLAAHYRLQSRESMADPAVKEKHRKFSLGAVVHHGVDVRTARQYFHDLNLLAVRLNTSLGLSMDTHDPLIRMIEELELDVQFLTGRVDKSSRQLARASHKVVTLQTLRQMTINVAKGIAGIQYGARPVALDDFDLDDLHEVARDWLNAVFNTFGSQVADRETFIISTPSVLAAVGAIGNRVLQAPPHERSQLRNQLIASLQAVDWNKGQHWVGVAGKINDRGKFVVGGTKEVAYAVYNVLSSSDNDGYQRVRGQRQPVTA